MADETWKIRWSYESEIMGGENSATKPPMLPSVKQWENHGDWNSTWKATEHKTPSCTGGQGKFPSGGSKKYMAWGDQEMWWVGEGLDILILQFAFSLTPNRGRLWPPTHPVSKDWLGCLSSWAPSSLTPWRTENSLPSEAHSRCPVWTCDC